MWRRPLDDASGSFGYSGEARTPKATRFLN